MNQSSPKKIIIIAGHNGAGKTTFAREFLPNEAACLQFVNADLIAAGLSPFAPESVMTPDLPQPTPNFPDLKQVMAALERAAQRARQIAEQTGTQLIVRTPPERSSETKPGHTTE